MKKVISSIFFMDKDNNGMQNHSGNDKTEIYNDYINNYNSKNMRDSIEKEISFKTKKAKPKDSYNEYNDLTLPIIPVEKLNIKKSNTSKSNINLTIRFDSV